jgi:hypothetical protein
VVLVAFLMARFVLSASYAAAPRLKSPAEIVRIGFSRSRVVMMNEVHDGMKRCVRTRLIGRAVLPVAHRWGARHLAMEALPVGVVEEANRTRRLREYGAAGLFGQPEMRALVQSALDLGWTLVAYEADLQHPPPDVAAAPVTAIRRIQWRETEQARNLQHALAGLPSGSKMLVWCGNGHHQKTPARIEGAEVRLMGCEFRRLAHIEPFCIDQGVTVDLGENPVAGELLRRHAARLRRMGGTAGVLRNEEVLLRGRKDMDAFLLSIENAVE